MFGGYQSLTKVRLSSNVLWITYSTLMISVFSTSCLYLIFKMPSCVNTTLMSKSFPLSTTLKPIYIRTTQWSIWNGCRRIKCRLTRATCLKNSIRSSATNDVNKITFLEREYVGRSREFRFCLSTWFWYGLEVPVWLHNWCAIQWQTNTYTHQERNIVQMVH